MSPEDKQRLVELLSGCAEVLGRELSPAGYEIYWRLLEGYEFAEVERAIHGHLMNPDSGQFFPKPADIEKAIKGDTRSQALQAWTLVRAAIGTVGSYESVTFDDVRTQAAVADMGGWISLCQTIESELPFRAAEFQQRYRASTLTPPVGWPAYLVGLIEQHNAPRGGLLPPLRAIGRLEAAQQVYLQAGGDPARLPGKPFRPPIERERTLPAIPTERAEVNRRRVGQLIARALA